MEGMLVCELFLNVCIGFDQIEYVCYVEIYINDMNNGFCYIFVMDLLVVVVSFDNVLVVGMISFVGGDDGLIGFVDIDFIGDEIIELGF